MAIRIDHGGLLIRGVWRVNSGAGFDSIDTTTWRPPDLVQSSKAEALYGGLIASLVGAAAWFVRHHGNPRPQSQIQPIALSIKFIGYTYAPLVGAASPPRCALVAPAAAAAAAPGTASSPLLPCCWACLCLCRGEGRAVELMIQAAAGVMIERMKDSRNVSNISNVHPRQGHTASIKAGPAARAKHRRRHTLRITD